MLADATLIPATGCPYTLDPRMLPRASESEPLHLFNIKNTYIDPLLAPSTQGYLSSPSDLEAQHSLSPISHSSSYDFTISISTVPPVNEHSCPYVPPASPASSDYTTNSTNSNDFYFVDNSPLSNQCTMSAAEPFFFLPDSDSDSEPSSDKESSDYLSAYSVNDDDDMEHLQYLTTFIALDPQMPLGDVLIAADCLTVHSFAMPNLIHYVSFDPTSNAMVTDPPTYKTPIQVPFHGVHCS
ncbi:hypothetical protein BDR04DRAFT_1158671 [Suillus decipiens]|nr:hypothetical protein BDR04DRAFT_1158671 [Suillus decipiens]